MSHILYDKEKVLEIIAEYLTTIQPDEASLLPAAAFYDDYIFYGECPGYGQTKDHMEQSIKDFTKYIVLKDNIPVGALSFKDEGDGHYYLGSLCVIPEYQGMGIGTKTFQYMLSVCPNWKEIHLLTPVDKKQNIKFYTEKCGFNIGKKVMDEKVEVINFYLNR